MGSSRFTAGVGPKTIFWALAGVGFGVGGMAGSYEIGGWVCSAGEMAGKVGNGVGGTVGVKVGLIVGVEVGMGVVGVSVGVGVGKGEGSFVVGS